MILQTSDPLCIARDPASLAAEWSELARRRARPSIFLTPDWIAVARAHDARAQLTLAIGETGVAALALEDDRTLTFAGGELTDEQDVVASAPHAADVAERFATWIADEDIAHAVFSYIPEDVSTATTLALVLERRGYTVHVERQVTSPRVPLQGDFDAYLGRLTKKERHELRRKMRRLEAGRHVSFRTAEGADIGIALDRFFALHRSSRGGKATFMTAANERLFRDLADALAARGWLRLGMLDVDGATAAVLYAFAYGGTLALYNAAYDPSLSSLSVGIVSHVYALRAAIDEGMHTYDLLRGDEPYKYDLGGKDHWLVRVEARRP